MFSPHVRRLVLPALLLAALPLHAQAFRDPATHASGFVRRDGVRIHYLEWTGTGPTIVLLPGYSLTAHAFDDIAARLAPRYRVIAVTPRGFGESDAPDTSAYTIATLVADLRTILDSLHVDRAAIVGHSLSGTVAARFALQYPARVTHLVMLDAFPYFAAEKGDSISALETVNAPDFVGDTTYDAAAKYLARYRFVPFQPAMLADLHVKPLGGEGGRRRALTEGYIKDQWASPPNLRQLAVPSLQLCAVPSVASEYPWLTRADTAYATASRYVTRTLRPFDRKLCDHYARTVPKGRTQDVAGSHYVFFTNPALTATTLRAFLEARSPR